jgi:hypothetical protein
MRLQIEKEAGEKVFFFAFGRVSGDQIKLRIR